MKNKKIAFIAQTGVMLALLIGVQFTTRSLSQFITGSLVNLILLVSLFVIGIASGITVAVLSPVLAFTVGMGPMFVQIVPFVAAGNAVFVIAAYFTRNYIARKTLKDTFFTALGLITAGAAKTLFLWAGLVKIALPLIPGIKEKQITVISAAFSWPQMVTALIGGALAMIITPLLKLAVQNRKT